MHRLSVVFTLLLVFGGVALPVAVSSSDADQHLVIGRIPAESVVDILERDEPLLRTFREQLNIPVTYRFAEDYEGILELMRDEKVDMVWLAPLAFVLSECYSDTSATYRPVLRPMRPGPEGTPGDQYHAIVFTHRESGVTSLEDLAGETVAFVDRSSASGFLFPYELFRSRGLNPETDFEVSFEGRHDAVVRAVLDGRATAGVTYEGAREDFVENGNPDDVLPKLEKTQPIPTSPILFHPAFFSQREDLARAIEDIMLGLNQSEEGRRVLKPQGITEYVRATSGDYDPLREVVRSLPEGHPAVYDICPEGPNHQ